MNEATAAKSDNAWNTTRGFKEFLLRPVEVISSCRRSELPVNLLAGLTIAAVAIPQAIAYASIAELPPQYGLYTAVVGAIAGALWGSSRFLSTGPVNATSLLTLPVLLAVAQPGTSTYLVAASTVAILAGIFRLLLATLRFGALVTVVSRTVLMGFTAGAAVNIAIGQCRHLLGLQVPAMPELYLTVQAILANIHQLDWPTVLVGLGTLVITLLLKLTHHRVPASFLAIASVTLLVTVLGLDESGVAVIGEIPRSLPPFTWLSADSLPDAELLRQLLYGSIAVSVFGLVEAVAAAQNLSRQAGDRLDTNQELFGQGVANIASGMFSGYPCSGSFTRSSLNYQSGATSQVAAVFSGLFIMLGMLVLAPWASLIPRAAISGVLLVVAWGMVDRREILRIVRSSRTETAVMLITFLSTLVFTLDFAVMAGVAFSLAFFVIKSALPQVYPVVPDPTYRHLVRARDQALCPQLGLLNIRGPLFFGATFHIEQEILHNHQRHPGQHYLVLRMHGVDLCDITGIEMLESIVNSYRRWGGDVFLVRIRAPVLNLMADSGFIDETLGIDHILEQEASIEFLFDEVLDPMVCIYECEHRVFAECQALEKHVYGEHFPPIPHHSRQPAGHLEPQVFKKLSAAAGALIVDVREPSEFRRGHIPDATLLPLRTLLSQASRLPMDSPLFLVCRSGRRTARALYMLEKLGYRNLHGLKGGMLACRAAGLPIVITPD